MLDQFLIHVAPQSGQDWIAIIAEVADDKKTDATVAKARASRATDSQPSLSLDAYVGTYRDPWYGDVHITMGGDDHLWFQSGRSESLSGTLEHFQYDTFIARWTDRRLNADSYVSFTLNPDGGIERIRMRAVSPATDFSFDFHDLDLVRQPPQ